MNIEATLTQGSTPAQDNTIPVPKQTTFHTPAGPFNASIRSVSKKFRLGGDSSIPFLRFVFTVHVPNAKLDYLAKLDVPANMNEGSELWNLLLRLVGRKALQDCSGGKLDLNALVGLSCDIEVEHVPGKEDRYDFPLVIVTDVREPGSLVKPLVKEEN